MAECKENTNPRRYQRRPSFCQSDTEKYRGAFDEVDSDNEGVILFDDLSKAASIIGYRLSDDQVENIKRTNGFDCGSKLTFAQFLDIIPRNTTDISKEQHRLAELKEKFQRYDLDNNGYISLSEAQRALQVELDVTQQTALRLLNQFIKLDYEHFVEFYGKVQEKKLEIYEMFGRYDQDLDGMISVEEAHIILHKELGYNEDRSRAMVTRFDINKDGRVSYVEFAEFYIAVEDRKARIRQAFQLFDQSKEGSVATDHAKQILQGYLGFSEVKADQAIQMYDKNKDGKIDYEEFLEFFSMVEEERQRLLSEFCRYDQDDDGKISFKEFQKMLTSEGYSQREIETIMAGYDQDKEDCLSFEEFRQFLNFS